MQPITSVKRARRLQTIDLPPDKSWLKLPAPWYKEIRSHWSQIALSLPGIQAKCFD
jgi:hypothetical protein